MIIRRSKKCRSNKKDSFIIFPYQKSTFFRCILTTTLSFLRSDISNFEFGLPVKALLNAKELKQKEIRKKEKAK